VDLEILAKYLIVALATVSVIVVITLAITHSVDQSHDIARVCIDHGGQWVNDMCMRGR
jgi:hypothetical protein